MVETVQHYYEHLKYKLYKDADLRTKDMLFMRNLDGVVMLTVGYVAFTFVGPRFMANRKAFDLKWPMFVYNISIALMSLWMFLEMVVHSWKANYNYVCDTYKDHSSTDYHEMGVVNAFWWYWASKAIEFLDTVFMVLKKKNSQITVLHVWHHSFMFPFLFIATLVGPCGQALLGPIINSFIHVMMYAYYTFSLFPSLQPYLWWKKYLTQMQLAQFFIILASSSYGLWLDCKFPHSLAWGELFFLSTLVVFFGNFYIQAYVKRKHSRAVKQSQSNGKIQNKKEL